MRAVLRVLLIAALLAVSGPSTARSSKEETADPPTDTSRLSIPFSRFASPEAETLWKRRARFADAWARWSASKEAARLQLDPLRLRAHWLRKWGDSEFLPELATKQTARYAVEIQPRVIAGVYTEVFTPRDGVAESNRHRVLINLHGGAFVAGARVGGRVESIPIAVVGRVRVISIDYRQAPEHEFPAASEDVAAVYRDLLKEYRPENIGIYGCSAGGMLVAQAIAHFVQTGMPRPGAVGMLCGTGEILGTGDAAYYVAALDGVPFSSAEQRQQNNLYLRNADPKDPTLFPMRHPRMVQEFPPSLFVSGTRAYEMSSVLDANNKLASAGVATELYVWDGVYHGFIHDPDLPESRQAYSLIARFFDRHLGTAALAARADVDPTYPPLIVPRREIPVPPTVSRELQQSLAQPAGRFDPPFPQTNAEWSLVSGTPREQEARIASLLAERKVTMSREVIGGVPCFVLTPEKIAASNRRRLLLNFHGGGYALGAGVDGTVEAILMAATADAKVIAVDYRLAPEFPFPAAADDTFAVWTALAARHEPARIGMFGTSSGGALVLTAVQRAVAQGLSVPGAIAVGTPWADLSFTGDSYFINDLGQRGYPHATKELARIYVDGVDLKDPRVSPVYGRFKGFPPTILTSGTRDTFLSNTVRVDQKLREVGVETRLQVFEGQNHAAYLDPSLPESKWVFSEIYRFMDKHLKK